MFKEKIINLNSIKVFGLHFILCGGLFLILFLLEEYRVEQYLNISCSWEERAFVYGLIQGFASLIILDKLIFKHYRDASFSKRIGWLLAVVIWGGFHSYYGIIGFNQLVFLWEHIYGIDDFLQKITKSLVLFGIYCFTPMSIILYLFNRLNKIFSKITPDGHLISDSPFGEAMFSSEKNLNKLSKTGGIAIGRALKGFIGSGSNLAEKILNSKVGNIIRYQATHAICIAPTGSGKGVSVVIPTILDHDGSVVVVDPKKAENYHVTANHRRKIGQEVCVLDPMGLTGEKSLSFNIFDFLPEESSDKIITIRVFSNALCPTQGDTKGDYFIINAQNLLSCLMLYVDSLACDKRNLYTIYEILNSGKKEFQEIMRVITNNETLGEKTAAMFANQALSTAHEEFSGVINSARQALRFLSIPCYRELTKTTSIKFDKLFANKLDVYLCVPFEHIRKNNDGASFLRLFICLFIHLVFIKKETPAKNILLLLDEMSAIGNIDQVGDLLKVGRSYGIRLLGISQTIGSLLRVYRADIDELLTSSLMMMFGLQTPSELDFVQKRIGTTTIYTKSKGESSNNGEHSKSTGESENVSSTRRELLNSSEIKEISENHAFVFMDKSKPTVVRKIKYYEDNHYKGKYDINPLEKRSNHE